MSKHATELPFGEFYIDVEATMPDGTRIERSWGPWSTREEAKASLAAQKRCLKDEGAVQTSRGRIYKSRS
jgi:hypothetical protein